MAQSIVGPEEFTEQPQRDQYRQGEGRTTIREWHGPRSVYEAKWAEIEATSPETMDGVKGTPAVITATYLPLDPATDNAIWELLPQPVDRSIALHPSFNVSGAQQNYLEQIDKAITEGKGQDTDWDNISGLINLNDYRNLKAKGSDSYRIWAWVVRRTLTSSLANAEQANDTDGGNVVTWSAIPFPANIKFAQPVYNKWDGVSVEPISINQWLTTPETVRYEKKMYTITKEWIGALGWYSILYNGGNAASDSDGSNLG